MASCSSFAPKQALRLKDDEPTLDCSDSRAEKWMQKRDLMYTERVHAAKFPQVQHWNLFADPGIHSYKDIMPSVAYSWEKHGAPSAISASAPGQASHEL